MKRVKWLVITVIILILPLSLADPILFKDKDPKLISDVSWLQNKIHETLWKLLTLIAPRNLLPFIFPGNPRVFYDVGERKLVALTIDDGFNSQGKKAVDMINEVMSALNQYNAKATFFVTGNHLTQVDPNKIMSVIEDGHELANHNWYDTNYRNYSLEKFKDDFSKTSEYICDLTGIHPPSMYRAPGGRISRQQIKWLAEQNYQHILADTFARDTLITEPSWIANYLAKNIKPGSIIVIHMPEKGFREWNLDALKKMLALVTQKGYRLTTLSEMEEVESFNKNTQEKKVLMAQRATERPNETIEGTEENRKLKNLTVEENAKVKLLSDFHHYFFIGSSLMLATLYLVKYKNKLSKKIRKNINTQ